MAKEHFDLSADGDELAAEPIPLGAAPSTRQLVSVAALLHEARDLVRGEARAKSLGVIVVGGDERVLVDRGQVVLVVATLLLDAIRAVGSRGRVAVTAQEIERELVVAVFDSSKPCAASLELGDLATEVACALGGRIWGAPATDGNLTLFAVPLYRFEN